MARPAMRKAAREIRDREMLKGILDMCKVINVGMFAEEYPYVVPLNYGYLFEDDLVFYTHHAPGGYKLDLIRQNPRVCVEANVFADGIVNPLSGSNHDFRSVIAFGRMEHLQPGSDDYRLALRRLQECNGRGHKVTEGYLSKDHSRSMLMYKITCKAEDVSGKSQETLRGPQDLPLPTTPKAL